jgi:hypothetical protein
MMEKGLCRFFNTIGLYGSALKAAQRKAGSQAGVLYRWMKERPAMSLTAHQLKHYEVLHSDTPYTSYVRSLVTLREMGAVASSNQKENGPLGMKVFVWRAIS